MRRLSIWAFALSLSGCVGVGVGSMPSSSSSDKPANGDTPPIAAPATAQSGDNGTPVNVTVTPPETQPAQTPGQLPPADPGDGNGPVVPANINPNKLRPPSP